MEFKKLCMYLKYIILKKNLQVFDKLLKPYYENVQKYREVEQLV